MSGLREYREKILALRARAEELGMSVVGLQDQGRQFFCIFQQIGVVSNAEAILITEERLGTSAKSLNDVVSKLDEAALKAAEASTDLGTNTPSSANFTPGGRGDRLSKVPDIEFRHRGSTPETPDTEKSDDLFARMMRKPGDVQDAGKTVAEIVDRTMGTFGGSGTATHRGTVTDTNGPVFTDPPKPSFPTGDAAMAISATVLAVTVGAKKVVDKFRKKKADD